MPNQQGPEPLKILACPYCSLRKRFSPTEQGIHALNTHIGRKHGDFPKIQKKLVYDGPLVTMRTMDSTAIH